MGYPNIIQDITNLDIEIDTKANDDKVVHLAGTETITGVKWFNSNLRRQNTDVDISDLSTLTSTSNTYFIFADKNTKTTAFIQNRCISTHNQLRFGLRTPGDTTTADSSCVKAYLQIDESGTVDFYGITPPTDANDRRIATTAWVMEKGVLIDSYISGKTYYRKYSDGWIEQGGSIPSGGASGWRTLTFPTAFSNTNYSIVVSCSNVSDITYWASSYTKTVSSVQIGTCNYVGTKSFCGVDWYACGY